MAKKRDIEYLLEEVVTLPSLPTTVAAITDLVNDPDSSLADIGKAISADPALALKTLRLVNSAYCGLRQKVSSVDHAVAMLGLKVIKNLVFTAMVFDTLQSSVKSLTRHSIGCGFAMRVLAEAGFGGAALASPEEAFVFGLLHDVGKIVFEQFLPEDFSLVASTSRVRKIPWYQAEREIIGADHAEMGARLAEKWKLGPELINAISGHHDLTKCREQAHRAGAAWLAVADLVCTMGGFAAYADAVVEVADDVWSTIGLSEEDVAPVQDAFREAVPSIEELVELAG